MERKVQAIVKTKTRLSQRRQETAVIFSDDSHVSYGQLNFDNQQEQSGAQLNGNQEDGAVAKHTLKTSITSRTKVYKPYLGIVHNPWNERKAGKPNGVPNGKSIRIRRSTLPPTATYQGVLSESYEDQAKNKLKKSHESNYIRLKNIADGNEITDTLYRNSSQNIFCTPEGCKGSILTHREQLQETSTVKKVEDIVRQAEDFITQYYEHIHSLGTLSHRTRWDEIRSCIEKTGTYELTFEELCFGAKTAWRNASRCIGRIQWSNLEVLDGRQCKTADEMFEMCCKHLEVATNGGNIRAVITLFRQRTGNHTNDYRIWNHELIKYAGYRQPDGSVIGDPAEVEFTEICQRLGWIGKGGRFDVLPLVLQASGEDPKLYEIPKNLILEVAIKHPKYEWFEQMNLKWFCVPAISNVMLDVGGLQFTAAPFNGWYMQTEIARDFCDVNRYNILEDIAKRLDLDTKSSISLWRDEAFMEMNKAILYSFKVINTTISDHHSASDSFIAHMTNEQRLRRGCPADWVWIVPPLGGSLCKVFHQEMMNYHLRPSYEYQKEPWTMHIWSNNLLARTFALDRSRSLTSFKSCALVVTFATMLSSKTQSSRHNAIILFATETGKSERYAKQACSVLQRAFKTRVFRMDSYDCDKLSKEELVLIVVSTFGNGDPPTNGATFYSKLQKMQDNGVKLANVQFSVFALGSSAYPHFCRHGKNVDRLLGSLDARRICDVMTGDELSGEAENFSDWLSCTFKNACNKFAIRGLSIAGELKYINPDATLWSPEKFKLIAVCDRKQDSIIDGLSALHHNKIYATSLISRENLHLDDSDDKTLIIKLKMEGSSMTYEPGDHIAIFPQHDSDAVELILSRVQADIDVNQPIDVESMSYNFHQNAHLPLCSLRTALSCYLDITTPPQPQFLKCLTHMAKNSEAKRLAILAKGEKEYARWRFTYFPSLIDVLLEFKSLVLNPSLLMTQLPVLQPRLYSISSSLAAHPGEIHLTVTLVSYTMNGTKVKRHKRKGLCTSWLNSIPRGGTIPAFIKPAPEFHLPTDPNVPILFIGAGSGIAPFRGFWQQLGHNHKNKVGESILLEICEESHGTALLFGCRSASRRLYKDEIESAKKNTALGETFVAYSRQKGQKKQYVQDILQAQAVYFAEKITNPNSHVYVCGHVQLAEDVQQTIAKILVAHKEYSLSEAKNFISQMKKSRRYHEDVFGVTKIEYDFKDSQEIGKEQRSRACIIL